MLDLAALARDNNIPAITSGNKHCQKGWLQLSCPFCSSGTGFHMGFNLTTGIFHCWMCGSLRAREVVERLLPGKSFGEIISKYGGRRQLRVVSDKERSDIKEIEVPDGFKRMSSVHHKYLASRGFDSVYLEAEWGLLGTEQRAEVGWSWRLIIPIHDHLGKLVNFQGRSLGEASARPRYMTWKPEVSSRLLYGEHKVIGQTDSILIVEGPADAWRLGPGAVATLGAGWSDTQAARISGYRNRHIFFDPDSTGVKRAEGLAEWLTALAGNTEILVGDVEPGDLSSDDAMKLMASLGIGRSQNAAVA